MLEFLRRSATSFFAWIILGFLAFVFALSFGLPSESLTLGPKALVKVDGHAIGDDEYRYQTMMMQNFTRVPEDPRMQQLMGIRQEILDATIERNLLAEIASDFGLAATTKDAEDLVVNGHVIAFHDTKDWLGDGAFNYEIFKVFLRNLQISEKKYLEIQRRELLAQTLLDLIQSSASVSETQVRDLYAQRNNRLSLRYAQYANADFAEFVDPSALDIQAWIDTHTTELEAAYLEQGARFHKLPRQARLWILELKAAQGDVTTATLKRRVKTLRGRIAAGASFHEVAREHSDHETARSGGDYGWVSQGSTTGLDPRIDESLLQLEVGELSEVIEGESAVFLIKVSDRREGDVPKDAALRELAVEAVKADRAPALAKRAAQEHLAAVVSGRSLEHVFEIPGRAPASNPSPTGKVAGDQRFRPELRETGSFSREDPIPGLGVAPNLVEAAWSRTPDEGLIAEVFPIDTGFALIGLAEKTEADDAAYPEARAELYRELVRTKGATVAGRFSRRSCIIALGTGQIAPDQDRVDREMVYQAKSGNAPPLQLKPYQICERVGNGGGMAQLGQLLSAGGPN